MFATNADQLWYAELLSDSRGRSAVHLRQSGTTSATSRSRTSATTTAFSAWARFFEDGIDNYHNPGNRSKYCSSWAFVQGGSPLRQVHEERLGSNVIGIG